jgi:hypothetical protein
MSTLRPLMARFILDHLGNDWNHSDDLLAFDSYWVLNRYAFSDDCAASTPLPFAIIGKPKRWSGIPLEFRLRFDRCRGIRPGGSALDIALLSVGYGRLDSPQFPPQDLTKLEKNFREQQTRELLPPMNGG